VANPAANISNAPIEMIENTAPIRVERYELSRDSGGAGQWRGGLGVTRQMRFLGERASFQLRSDRRRFPPFGLAGGLAGAPSTNLSQSPGGQAEQWPTKFTRGLSHDQVFTHRTAGGGGFGDPLARPAEKVLEDVLEDKVSIAAARELYGVVIDAASIRVDEAATSALRASRRTAR
jgi:N-methylhydantoinase B